MFTGWIWGIVLIAVVVFAFWPRGKNKNPLYRTGNHSDYLGYKADARYHELQRRRREQRHKEERERAARLKKAKREVDHRYHREMAKLENQRKERQRREMLEKARRREADERWEKQWGRFLRK